MTWRTRLGAYDLAAWRHRGGEMPLRVGRPWGKVPLNHNMHRAGPVAAHRSFREVCMKRALFCGVAAIAVAAFLVAAPVRLSAQSVPIDGKSISGVVKSPHGAEAGGWVIAQTNDLGTRFAKMVVTDDQGRYVLPDLPKAKYKVWVRGYGLVDSAKVDSEPGKQLNLTAAKAPNAAAAAQYYPAVYWYSMLK